MIGGRFSGRRPAPAMPRLNGRGAATQARPLRVAADATRPNTVLDTATAGNEFRQSRMPHYVGRADVSELWLVYANWIVDTSQSGREVSTGNACALECGLECNGVTVVAGNAGVGSGAYFLPDGATYAAGPFKPSDFALSVFPAGAKLYSRTGMKVSPGQRLPRTAISLSADGASRTVGPATDASQIGGTGAFSGTIGGTAAGPIMVIGRSVADEIAMVELGDSIAHGQFDTPNGGYTTRAFSNVGGARVPLALLGKEGSTLSRMIDGASGEKRKVLLQYATHVLIAYGANDLFYSVSQDNYGLFKANLLTLIGSCRAAGIRHVTVVHIAPRTQSNNSFVNSAAQLPQGTAAGVAGWWDAAEIAGINTWIDTLKTNGTIDQVFDVNAHWGESGGCAKWVSNGTPFYAVTNADGTGVLGSPYLNGTHPTPALHVLAAPALAAIVGAMPKYR